MLYKFKEDNFWGMINEKGQVAIRPIYKELSDITEGFALGTVNEKWFYINKEGSMVKKFNVDGMTTFHEDMAAMRLCGCVGFINKKFQVVIEPKYSLQTYSFNEGLASVATPKITGSTLYGFINEKGEEVIDIKYESAGNFSEGLAVVMLNNKYGVIDKSGKMVLDYKYDWLNDFKEGRAFFTKDDLWGIVDNKGNEIAEVGLTKDEDNCEHYEMQYFKDGFGVIRESEKYGYIDREGKRATDIIYDYASSFSEGITWAKIGNKWFILDKGFNTISGFNCEAVREFKDGLAGICIDGKWGYIDKTGSLVIKRKYDEVFDFNLGAAAVIIDGKYGYIDSSGREFFIADKSCSEP